MFSAILDIAPARTADIFQRQWEPGIFVLGWQSNFPNPDPKAGFDTNGQGGTTEAHGNYDYLNNAVTWDLNYSNHTLPNSFFLSSAPSFFSAGASCTYPWPWVTPTATSPIQTNSCNGSGLPAKGALRRREAVHTTLSCAPRRARQSRGSSRSSPEAEKRFRFASATRSRGLVVEGT